MNGEIHLCEDCQMFAVNGEFPPETSEDRDIDISAGLYELTKDGTQVISDFNHEGVIYECDNCGMISPLEDCGISPDTEDYCCPQCESLDLTVRSSGVDEFSNRRCDCCGTEQGGARYRFILLNLGNS